MLVTLLKLSLCAVHAGLRGSCFITFLIMKFLMQQSLRVSYKQSNGKASLGSNSPMSFLVAQAWLSLVLHQDSGARIQGMLIQCTVHNNSSAVVLTNHWNNLSMATVFFSFWSPSVEVRQLCLFFLAVGIPVPEQKGKSVREVAGSVWGLKDSNSCVSSFEVCRGAACYCRNVSRAPVSCRQGMPTLWIWHCETRPSTADSAASSSPWL